MQLLGVLALSSGSDKGGGEGGGGGIGGAGVGEGKHRTYEGIPLKGAPHTEYSRMLAEHGVFGLAAMLALAWLRWQELS